MTRVAVAGCTALAVLSAAAVLDFGSKAAEAAPSVSPFAGNYVGPDPSVNPYAGTWDPADPRGFYSFFSSWPISISDGGRITASLSDVSGSLGSYTKGTMTGRVADDGSFSLTVSVTHQLIDETQGQGRSRKSVSVTRRSETTGTMVLDADGNIIGMPLAGPTGGTFVWLRQ